MSNEVLYFGGVMNFVDPIFSWQVYIWSWVVLLILSGICYAIWHYSKWTPFKPLHGLYYAFKAQSFAAFIFNLSLIAELYSERDAKCIFDYSRWTYEIAPPDIPVIGWLLNNRFVSWLYRRIYYYPSAFLDDLPFTKALIYKFGKRNMDVEIARKLQNNEWEDSPSVTIGGIRTDIILDGDNWTLKGTPQHKAIVASAETWNELNENDQIHSYSKYQKYLLENRIAKPQEIKATVIVPWVRIDAAFPTELEDNEMAGYRRQAAEDEMAKDSAGFSKYYLPVLGGGAALSAFILIIRFLSLMIAK